MIDDLIGYYTEELNYLRQTGGDFAKRHPTVAGRLGLQDDGQCGDPHVERLLQGVALLTARVRRKIDDEFPEITDALLGLLYPHFQRPIPSAAVVQFQVKKGATPSPEASIIPRETLLKARPVGGVECRFVSRYPVRLWPLEVAAARLETRVVLPGQPPDAKAMIRLTLTTVGGLRVDALPFREARPDDGPSPPDRLRFYLDGTDALPFALYELLLNHVVAVQVRTPGDGTPESLITLKPSAIEPVGFAPDEGLVDYPARSFPGHRLLQEYFALPAKFLFFDLTGLSRLSKLAFGSSVEVVFYLDETPEGVLVVVPDNFRLGCTPVVNLFPAITAPIPLNQTRFDYPVLPDVDHPEDAEVYTVDRVTGTGSLLEDDVEYEPFYSVRHSFGPAIRAEKLKAKARDREAFWYASRRPSTRASGALTEVALSFVDSGFNPHVPARSKITVEATCTNGDLPSRLPFTDGRLTLDTETTSARCLHKPTRSLRPPLRRLAQWRLISALALNHLSLVDSVHGLQALRELLAVHDFAETPATTGFVQGITRVSGEPDTGRTGVRGGSVCRGVRVTVEFNESKYVGNSAFLLASVLDRFFAQYASVNAFTRLAARAQAKGQKPERTMKIWPPRAGERTLL